MILVRAILLLAAFGGCSACARRHGDIAPEAIPPWAYEPASCRELALMQAKTMRTLVFSSLVQDQHHADDRTRTFGVPTPMATIFEDSREAEVSRLKGESLAIALEIQRKGCVAREG